MTRSVLVLEDGSVFHGRGFGARTVAEAEVVFNTCMTGYQEIATDASYRGQMVCMTYPLIGNYGVIDEDSEASRPWISALIVRDLSAVYSNWRASGHLDAWLERHGVPAIADVDTRALTRRLRSRGAMRAVLAPDDGESTRDGRLDRARSVRSLGEQDLIAGASTESVFEYSRGVGPTIVVVDCGIKANILRSLAARDTHVIVVPYHASAETVRAQRPDGIVISNGPGDPTVLGSIATMVRELMQDGCPILGICLGHQLMGMAVGATTSRLPFGHHGGNHAVRDLADGKVHITSQNHEFQVDRDSLPPGGGLRVSSINLNDGSVEGLIHESKPFFSVQYHPEGAPGPRDNQYVFDRFLSLVRSVT